MKNQSQGYRKLAEAILGVALDIEAARTTKSRRKADGLMKNASGRATALARLLADYAEALSEAEKSETVKH